ncbi:MAG: type I methionyl aminopeptidase [Bdellovibrionales bacterium]|nr:type I methionyl aminopeptidase [Bdellovibrionales bacterium]
MIHYKTPQDVEVMKKSCRLAGSVLTFIEPYVKAGITTLELDKLCHDYIVENGAKPSPLNYKGYPKSICTSVNNVVCHGIPDNTVLKEGDIVNLDITTYLDGYHGDTSKTFTIGKVSRAARDLVAAAEEALWIGIYAAKPGAHTGDIGEAVQKFVEGKGFSVVRDYCGHGIGKNFHEDPPIVHFGRKGTGALIKPGMVFTVEPMVNLGTWEVDFKNDDGWTVVTKDRKLSAQFEHTIAIFEDRVEVLTLPPNSDRNPITWKK